MTPKRAAQVQGLVAGLDRSQWQPAAQLAEQQFALLAPLLQHARATTAYYAAHWGGAYHPGAAPGAGALARLPLLARRELQEHYEEICSRAVPAAHGRVAEGRTSGSSGMPVRVRRTTQGALRWAAIT
ncbi:MAG: hypothetical protein ACREVG_09570, partial [Burkholderiales bacterium]